VNGTACLLCDRERAEGELNRTTVWEGPPLAALDAVARLHDRVRVFRDV